MNRINKLQHIIKTRFGGSQAEFARAIDRSPSVVWQYLNGHRQAGEKFARHVEQKAAPAANVEAGPDIKGRVPLISWVRAGEWTEAVDLFEPGDAEEWVECPFTHSDSSYALRVQGISMAPEFQAGDIIIVDPTRQPSSGLFVIAKKHGTNEATFKQLHMEGGDAYLKALNPDWPEKVIKVEGDWSISGVVVGKMKAY